jgi:hypothetical protein
MVPPLPRFLARVLVVAVVCVGGGCMRDSAEDSKAESKAELEAEAPTESEPLQLQLAQTLDGATTPNLSVGTDGTVVLTWQEYEPTPAVRWRRRDQAGKWSDARGLASSDDLFVNWADFPIMVSFDERRIVGAWLQRSSPEAYGVQLAFTGDGGTSWSSPRALHEHVGGPEYGFVSMTAIEGGKLRAFWLDGRESKGHHGGAMQLRAATLDPDGTVSDRVLIDDRVCDCCQTAAATTASGPVVVFRDRSDEEVRDISIAGPGPDQRRRVAPDGWKIAGCPVNGPSVSARGSALAVAWFSAANDAPRVSVAMATEDGEFSAPISVATGKPMGRVDVEWVDDDRLLVSYVDRTADDGAALFGRVVGKSGTVGAPSKIASVPSSNASGFPRLARVGETFVWAWTEASEAGPRVRVAEVGVAAL